MTRPLISDTAIVINRRQFLTRVGLGGAVLPLSVVCSTVPAGVPPSTGSRESPARAGAGPKVGLCTIAFQERPLFEVLEIAARTGFDGVEPWGKADHLPLSTPDSRVRGIRTRLDDLGLSCSHRQRDPM